MNTPLKTPVAFIVFNRPDCTRKVFERIRDARPEKLYLIADGPRPHKPGEDERCAETRRIVEGMIDWPCDVHRNYAEQNMGCRWRVASGISWVFEHEETAIILEDDCLPSQSFFKFCQEMLNLYRTNKQIMHICGTKRISYKCGSKNSYFFSRYTPVWGWATWKRAWGKYDAKLSDWPDNKRSELLKTICLSPAEVIAREKLLDTIYSNQLDTWDFGWTYTVLREHALAIVPQHNLIRNIGFDQNATHTINPFNPARFANLGQLEWPLKHPKSVMADERHDRLYNQKYYPGNSKLNFLKTLILGIIQRARQVD